MKKCIYICLLLGLAGSLSAQKNPFPDKPYLFLELEGGLLIANDGFGINGSIGAGYQFSDLAGVGISLVTNYKPGYHSEGFSGIGLQYRLHPGKFLFKTDFGIITNYHKGNDYCIDYYVKGTYFYNRTYVGIRLGRVVTLGAVLAIVPEHVKFDTWCPDDISGEYEYSHTYNTGFIFPQPAIGLTFRIFNKKNP